MKEERKLISMVEFVLKMLEAYECNVTIETEYNDLFQLKCNIDAFCEFLKQPLSIEQFVPCKLVDDVWVVLKEPKHVSPEGVKWEDYVKEYQEAKSRCIFEGFDWVRVNKNKNQIEIKIKGYIPEYEGSTYLFSIYNIDSTIEDLVLSNLTLTEAKAKELGL